MWHLMARQLQVGHPPRAKNESKKDAMTPPDIPTIYQGEAQLLSWSDTSTAGPKIVLALPDDEALECFKHLTMGRKAGQRMMIAAVHIGDDEQPVDPRPLMKSAGMVCKSAEFQRFVAHQEDEEFESADEREEQAAKYVRNWCGVSSRTELDSDREVAERFKDLMWKYRQFLGKP